MRPSWQDYFLSIAKVVATRSTCLRIPDGVGAVIVRDKQILSTGYAGSIRGLEHCTGLKPGEPPGGAQIGCLIDEKTGGCVRTVHAEINAILQAAQHGVAIEGATIYTTMSPCWPCFTALANGGVKEIFYSVEYRTVDRQKEFAALLNLPFVHVGTEKYTGEKPKYPDVALCVE
jgi:dCMP deaminase